MTTLIAMRAVSFFRMMQRVSPHLNRSMHVVDVVDKMCTALNHNLRKPVLRQGQERGGGTQAPPSPRLRPRKHVKYQPDEREPACSSDRGRGRQSAQRQRNCWECRRWSDKYRQTTFRRPDCGVPVYQCLLDHRRLSPDRSSKTCLQLHPADCDPEHHVPPRPSHLGLLKRKFPVESRLYGHK